MSADDRRRLVAFGAAGPIDRTMPGREPERDAAWRQALPRVIEEGPGTA